MGEELVGNSVRPSPTAVGSAYTVLRETRMAAVVCSFGADDAASVAGLIAVGRDRRAIAGATGGHSRNPGSATPTADA